jgi:hypothetical protein
VCLVNGDLDGTRAGAWTAAGTRRRDLPSHDKPPDRREMTGVRLVRPCRSSRSLPRERLIPGSGQHDIAVARRDPQLVARGLVDPLRPGGARATARRRASSLASLFRLSHGLPRRNLVGPTVTRPSLSPPSGPAASSLHCHRLFYFGRLSNQSVET